jgi:hypothetical protein
VTEPHEGENERFNEIKEMFKMNGSKLRNKLAYISDRISCLYICVCVYFRTTRLE